MSFIFYFKQIAMQLPVLQKSRVLIERKISLSSIEERRKYKHGQVHGRNLQLFFEKTMKD